ncbi:MAG: two component, sigma54 specific, transcriptional regulator, Fis family [Myxococcaceae bacterium]|nr:two component, sigma54 specific, transcriptional regulator, Fis family [Myxococcaceae bacterium]
MSGLPGNAPKPERRPPPRWLAFVRRPAFLPFVASSAYVAAASLRAAGGHGVRTWVLGIVAVVMAARASHREKRGAALAEWGLALVLASIAAPEPDGWIDAFGSVGALIACVGAVRAMFEIEPLGCAARVAPGQPVVVYLLLGIAWCGAFASYAEAASLGELGGNARVPGTIAGVLAAAVLFIACVREGSRRALELGVADRFRVSAISIALLFALAAGLALTAMVAPDRAVRLAAAFAGLLVARIAIHKDAVEVARASRICFAVASAGGPVLLIGALTALDRPRDAAVVAFCTGVAALGVGAIASALADPLRPARGAWLDAIEKAHDALRRSDPEEALRELLVALREPAGHNAASPELWTFDPVRVLSIDAAGYVRERDGLFPGTMVEAASGEPEAVLRTEVLDALEVRRPDLRPLLRWMEDRAALLAAVVTRGGEAEGLLVLPRGSRGDLVTLEEARAIKRLADQLASVCLGRGVLALSLAREHALSHRDEAADEAAARLDHDAAIEAARHARATMRLARPATVGIYSASSREAYDTLERRTRAGAPIAIVAPSGIDPIPYLARAHLSGVRAGGAFVLVEGTAAREHDLARWIDPASSPLALADKGMLVLVDGAALPHDVQRLIGRAVAERRPPWERAEPLDVVLALTTVNEPEELVKSFALDVALGSRLADALESPVRLPRIRERPEDLRAILTDRLAREGMRVLGSPVGLDDGAYACLMDYPFPGEDAEIAALVQRLVARCAASAPPRSVVRPADIADLRLDTAVDAVPERGKIRLV